MYAILDEIILMDSRAVPKYHIILNLIPTLFAGLKG
jgi:hypothetical protein